MKPELISFKLCPYVQRSVVTLLYKNVDFNITYIDLANKPDWFLKISPLGKVPVLRIGDDVLFESAVINEYLDETTLPSLHPKDSLEKAKNRAWIEFGSGIFMDFFQMSTIHDGTIFEEKREAIMNKLERVEEQVKGDFFNGQEFSLIDAAYAPALQRLTLVDKHLKLGILDNFPKISNWRDKLMALEAVKKSVVEDFEELYIDYIKNKGSHMGNLLKQAAV